MTNRRRWLEIGGIAAVIIAAVGFIVSWKDTQTEFSIHDKINEGINVGMEELYQVAPRVGVIGSDYTYYVPDTDHLNNNTFTVYKDALEYVNSDLAAPICKITKVSIWGMDNMEVLVTYQYRGFFGLIHTVSYSEAINSPQFKNPTGDAHY